MRRPRRERRAVGWCALALSGSALGGCATTIDSSNTTAPPGSTTTTVFVPAGDTAAVIGQLLGELSGLSEAIVDNEHQREIVARADTLYAAARPGIESAHPGLVDDFDEAMALAHNGVDKRRPADADRALSNLQVLVDALAPVTSPTPDATEL